MRVLRVALAIPFAALLFACEAGVADDGGCVRNGDCSPPLACVLGRCREECLTQRDCPLGGLCVEQAGGARGCIPADEPCDESCTSPLVCQDDRCRNPCTSSDTCLGGSCLGGVCVADASDAGSSDAGSNDAGSSDAGSRDDAGPSDAGSRDDAGTLQGRVCGSTPECGAGARCGDGRCLLECDLEMDTQCPAGARCNPAGQGYPGSYYTGLGAGLGLCTDLCDPVRQDGCPAVLTCDVLATGSGFYTYCRTPGARPLGAACDITAQCAAGTICEVVTGFDAGVTGRACLAFCDPTARVCPPGWGCGMSDVTESGIPIGVCNVAP